LKVKYFLVITITIIMAASCQTSGTSGKATVLRDVPRESRTNLMVVNFKNITVKDMADKYQPWEFGLPAMMMTDLESIGLFNILSWERIEDILEQQKLQSLGLVSEEEAVKIGKLAAARFMLSGTFMVVNGSLRIESKIFSIESGTQLSAASVTGKLDRFFDLEKELVIEMTSYLGAALSANERDQIASGIETRSLDASLDNYAGEIAMFEADRMKNRGKTNQADELLNQAKARFEAALNHDPGYERAKNNLSSLTMAIPMTL